MNIIVQPLTLRGENVITRKSLLRLLLLSALLIVLTATALAAAADDFTFTLNSSGSAYTVTAYNGSASSVTVPDWYENLPVTAIGSGAFQGNTALTSVSLPSSITRIGVGAFKNCPNLDTVSTYTAASEPPAETERVAGDVNEDGKVNARDALAVIKYSAGQDVTINTANADVNADGKINARDALAIIKYSAGQDVTLQ